MTNRTGLRKLNANPEAAAEPGIACRDTHVRLICSGFHSSAVKIPLLVGFPSCFAAVAAQRDRCNHAFIKMLMRARHQSTATSLMWNKPTRHGFEIGCDVYRNILDLLCERRDTNGDLLIWGDFTKCWIASILLFILEKYTRVCCLFREMVGRGCLCFP